MLSRDISSIICVYDLSSLIQRAFNKDEPLRCYDIKHYMNNIFILLTKIEKIFIFDNNLI